MSGGGGEVRDFCGVDAQIVVGFVAPCLAGVELVVVRAACVDLLDTAG